MRHAVAPLIACLALLAAPAAARATDADADADAALERLFAESDSVERLVADFVQIKQLKALAKPHTQTGTLVYVKGGDIVWRYETPFEAEFVLSGSRARVRYPGMGEESEFDLESDERIRPVVQSMTIWLGGDLATVREAYDVDLSGDDGRTLTLTPRDEMLRGFVQRIVLSYGPDHLVREVRIEEPDGDATILQFTNREVVRAR